MRFNNGADFPKKTDKEQREEGIKSHYTPPVAEVLTCRVEKGYRRSGGVGGTNLEEEQNVYQAVSDNPDQDNSFFGSRFGI